LAVRILIVSQYFHPENFRVNQLVLALKEAGHSVVVLTGQPNYPSGRFFPGHGFAGPARERPLGIEIIRVPLLPRGTGGAVRLFLNYLK
jgi:colanic acid biosynthesis glycosyl transferase WcaI